MILLDTINKKTIEKFKVLLEKIRNGEDTGKKEIFLPAKVIIPNNVESIEIEITRQDKQKFNADIPKENITFVTTNVNYQEIARNSTNQQNCRILPWKLNDNNSQQIIEAISEAISKNTIRLGVSIKFVEAEDIEDNLSNVSTHSLDTSGAMNNMVQELNKIESLKIESEKELEKVKADSQYALSQANRELEKVKLNSQYALERERRNIAEVQRKSDYYYQLAADRYTEVRELQKLTKEVESLKSQLATAQRDENYYYRLANDRYDEIEKLKEKLKELNLDWKQKYCKLNSQFSDYQCQAEQDAKRWKEYSDRLNLQNANYRAQIFNCSVNYQP